jgi:hypothetical protein
MHYFLNIDIEKNLCKFVNFKNILWPTKMTSKFQRLRNPALMHVSASKVAKLNLSHLLRILTMQNTMFTFLHFSGTQGGSIISNDRPSLRSLHLIAISLI